MCAIYVDDRWYSSDVNTLPLKDLTYAEGNDPNLGSWNETQLNYDLIHSVIHTKIVGSIRQWKSISTGDQIMSSSVLLDDNSGRIIIELKRSLRS